MVLPHTQAESQRQHGGASAPALSAWALRVYTGLQQPVTASSGRFLGKDDAAQSVMPGQQVLRVQGLYS